MEKLLAMTALGQRAYGRWLFQRLLSHAIALVGLIFIIAILSSALLIGVLFVGYTALLQYGMPSPTALLIISGGALSLILILVLIALSHLQHLRQLPHALFKKSPIVSHITNTFDAFVDGLMKK